MLYEAPLFGRTANPWDLSRTLRRIERRGGRGGGGRAGADRHRHRRGRVEPYPGGVLRGRRFKQTLGLVPHDLTPDGFGNQSHITPMTRTVMDTALMLQAMAGPHPCDPHALGLPVPDFVTAARPEGDLKGVRIGWRPISATQC